MEVATPVQLRKSMEVASALVSAGIRFVCIPVFNDDDWNEYTVLAQRKLGQTIDQIEEESDA